MIQSQIDWSSFIRIRYECSQFGKLIILFCGFWNVSVIFWLTSLTCHEYVYMSCHVMNMFTCHVYVYSDSHNMFLMYSDLKKFYFARQCKWNSLLRLEKGLDYSDVKWNGLEILRPWNGLDYFDLNEMVWIYYDRDIVCVYSELIWKGLDLLQPWNGLDLLRV